jgi:hypothetical protein
MPRWKPTRLRPMTRVRALRLDGQPVNFRTADAEVSDGDWRIIAELESFPPPVPLLWEGDVTASLGTGAVIVGRGAVRDLEGGPASFRMVLVAVVD